MIYQPLFLTTQRKGASAFVLSYVSLIRVPYIFFGTCYRIRTWQLVALLPLEVDRGFAPDLIWPGLKLPSSSTTWLPVSRKYIYIYIDTPEAQTHTWLRSFLSTITLMWSMCMCDFCMACLACTLYLNLPTYACWSKWKINAMWTACMHACMHARCHMYKFMKCPYID